MARGGIPVVMALAIACSGDDAGPSSGGGTVASDGTSTGATGKASQGSASTADSGAADDSSVDGGDLDCSGVEIPGCDEVVEVCQGGQCDCLCSDPVGTDDDGGGECPPILPAGACEESCMTLGAFCGTDTCCGCAFHEGETAYWVCGPTGQPDCPPTPPNVGDGCSVPGAQCWYCTDAFAYRTCDDVTWTTITEWTCPG
jgi:hypothetical protein